MKQQITDFLNHLHRGGEYAHYWYKNADGPYRKTLWFKVGDPPTPTANPTNVYFGVNPTSVIPPTNSRGEKKPPSAVRSQNDYVQAINCFYGDFDAKDRNGSKSATLKHIESLAVQPSVIIDSGGGYHCYWLLDEPFYDMEKAADYIERWVEFVGADPGAKDLARILRVPGTRNLKKEYAPDYPTVFFVECSLDLLYTIEELERLLPERELETTPNNTPQVATNERTTLGNDNRRQKHWRRAVDTATQMIQLAKDGNKHDTLIKASRLLGGYIAGGMGTTIEAAQILESAISAKPNVDDMGAARVTITDGVAYGANSAIPFERLERERREWIALHTKTNSPDLPELARLAPDMGADACPWLDDYIEFSRRWSPRAFDGFHEACALFVLSTIAGRRVVLHLGGARYPSLYIALAARTSLWAKTTTAMIARQVIECVGLGYFLSPDDATPQAFIKSLTSWLPDDLDGMTDGQRARTENRLSILAARGWFYEEFGQKLAQMMREGGFMADFRGHLRRFDDHPERYEYSTIGRGTDVVERPYLALLANMTPADMRKSAKRGASMWSDGFWARFAFVTPSGRESNRARFPMGERYLPQGITQPLIDWHNRLGLPSVTITETKEMDGDDKGKKRKTVSIEDKAPVRCSWGDGVLDAFYTYHDALLDIVEDSGNHDFDGNYVRFAEKAMRVAILLASLTNVNKIEMRHWARAQEIAERWRDGLHALYDQVTSADTTDAEELEERVIALIAGRGWMTARQVSQSVRGVDSGSAKILLDGLIGDVLKKEKVRSGRTSAYAINGTSDESRP